MVNVVGVVALSSSVVISSTSLIVGKSLTEFTVNVKVSLLLLPSGSLTVSVITTWPC